jgi:hypothetical protein
VSSTAGRASNRLEATRRDDGTVALDVGLRLEGDADQEVVGGLLVATSDLPLVRAALDRVLADLGLKRAKGYDLEAVRARQPAVYARWPAGRPRKSGGCWTSTTVAAPSTSWLRAWAQAGRDPLRLQRLGRLDDDRPAADDP